MPSLQTTAAGSKRKLESCPNVSASSNGSSRPMGIVSGTSARILDIASVYGFKLFAFAYGFICFCVLAARAAVEGSILKQPRQDFWIELQRARMEFWDLSSVPYFNVCHAFFTLLDGTKLHYLTSELPDAYQTPGVDNQPGKQNLVIFLHGWPDTCALWERVITALPASIRTNTTLIAVDLPGFGGSDGLPNYGPDGVMNAILEFVVGMRSLHSKNGVREVDQLTDRAVERGQIVIVGHDWGALLGFKLAAQAPQLADRFILCNSVLPELALKNCKRRWSMACKLFREWKNNFPAQVLPVKPLSPLLPVIRQIGLSVYVFIFNLPMILARMSISKCKLWALRLVSSIAQGHRGITHNSNVISHMASFMGPNQQVVDTRTLDGQGYGATVHQRAAESISVESLCYYRDGLASKPWKTQDHQTVLLQQLDHYNHEVRQKKLIGTLKTEPLGRLNVPATIIWGERDPALDARLTLENLNEYMTEESQVIRLPRVGHWTPLEGEGPKVVATVLEWALNVEPADGLEKRVKHVCADVKMSLMQ